MTHPPGALKNSLRTFIIWISLPTGILVFMSLWMTQEVTWHGAIAVLTILLGFSRGVSLKMVLQRILPLVIFLLLAQLLLSSYSRSLFFALFQGEFDWTRWQYPIFAVERLALPLIAVIAFQRDLADPRTMRSLGAFVQPLIILRFPVMKFQLMLSVALKFLPFLRSEWERFYQAREAFQKINPSGKRTLRNQLKKNVVVLKAMISHIIRKAGQTGDMLALRGNSLRPLALPARMFMLLLLIWIILGMLFHFWFPGLQAMWLFIGIWYTLMQLSLSLEYAS